VLPRCNEGAEIVGPKSANSMECNRVVADCLISSKAPATKPCSAAVATPSMTTEERSIAIEDRSMTTEERSIAIEEPSIETKGRVAPVDR